MTSEIVGITRDRMIAVALADDQSVRTSDHCWATIGAENGASPQLPGTVGLVCGELDRAVPFSTARILRREAVLFP